MSDNPFFRGERLRRVVLVLLFAGTGLAAGAPVSGAPPVRGAVPLAFAPEVSILSEWTRYSGQGGRDLLGLPVDPARTERELSRLADRLRPAVAADPGGAGVPDAFRRILIREEGFAYDPGAGNPENYLLACTSRRRQCRGARGKARPRTHARSNGSRPKVYSRTKETTHDDSAHSTATFRRDERFSGSRVG